MHLRPAVRRRAASDRAYDENQQVKAGGVEMPIKLVRQDEVQPVTTTVQPLQPIQEIGNRSPVTFLERQPPIGLIAQTVLRAVQDRYKPYEDFTIIRIGVMQENERALIKRCIDAAIQWTAGSGRASHDRRAARPM